MLSPSATLQSANVSWREALYMSGALVFISGASVFAAAAQGRALDYLVARAGIGETVLGRLQPPGHSMDGRLSHTSWFFCEGGLFACPGASA